MRDAGLPGFRSGCAAAAVLVWLAGCTVPGARVIDAPHGQANGATVVLVHGLSRRSGSLMRVGDSLQAMGYRVCRIDYPSMHEPPEVLVEGFARDVAQCAEAGTVLHFVTHSLGGIVLRAWVREHPDTPIGRVVMLSPPNHGTRLADVAARSVFLGAILGPTAVQLGTDPGSFPGRLGPATFAVGIIAGDRSIHPLGTFLLERPNDGTVTAASARLAGMRDFAIVRKSHSFIMRAPEVVTEVAAFLATGCFSRQLETVSYDDTTPCAGLAMTGPPVALR